MSAPQKYPYKSGRYGSHAAVQRLLGPGAGRTALDIGCGGGFVAAALGDLGWTVDGVESDPVLAAQARSHCREVFEIDANDILDHVHGEYDVLILGDVLEHVVDPAALLRQSRTLLRQGGFIAVSVPNVAHAFVRLSLMAGRFDYQDRGILDRTHLRFFTRRTFRAMVRQCGFTIQTETATPAPIEEVWSGAATGGRAEFLQPLGAGMARVFPTLFGYQFVVSLVPNQSAQRIR